MDHDGRVGKDVSMTGSTYIPTARQRSLHQIESISCSSRSRREARRENTDLNQADIPPARRSEPMLAARPLQTVWTGGRMCYVSQRPSKTDSRKDACKVVRGNLAKRREEGEGKQS
jgi:hypothetical protein